MDTEAQLREALTRLPAPTDNEDWYKLLTPLKSAGFDLEEVVDWSRAGGVKGEWIAKLRQRWDQLREMDHDYAVNTVFKRARGAGWQGGPARSSSSRRAPTPPDLARMAGPQKSFPGTVRRGAYTVADLKAESMWFVHSGKAPYQHEIEGGLAGYRQSLPPERGDVARARYGGEIIWEDKHRVPHRFLVYPHRPYLHIADLIPRLPNRHGRKLFPSISLAGNAAHPHPTDLVIVDFDLKPAECDETGLAVAFRNRVKTAAIGKGALVCLSTSGNGFHAVFRMPPAWVHTNRARGTETRYPKNRKEKVGGGASIDIFPAGFRYHVALKLENAVTDASPEAVIPYIGETELWRMLTDAANAARADVARAAEEQPQEEQEQGRDGEEQEATRDAAEQEQSKETENHPSPALMAEAEEPGAQQDADVETEQAAVNGKMKPPPGSWDGWWEEDGSEGGSTSATVRFHATQGPDTFTLKDLQETKIWFAGWGESAWQHKINGDVHGFRHSMKDADGGLRVARFGGNGWWDKPSGERVPIQVYPWATLADLEARMEAHNVRAARTRVPIRPCMALSGTADIPHPQDVMVIYLDYSPEEDPDGIGAAFRDSLAVRLARAGSPMFSSTSGNGWHALVREDGDFLREAQENGTEVRFPRKVEEKLGGAVAEMFPAGAKRHVVVRWEKARANWALETPIPVISREWLREVLEAARAMAEGHEEQGPGDTGQEQVAAQKTADQEQETTQNATEQEQVKVKPPPGIWDGWLEEDGSEGGSTPAEERPAEPAPPLSRTEKQRRRREELMRSPAGIRQAIRQGWYKPEH